MFESTKESVCKIKAIPKEQTSTKTNQEDNFLKYTDK